MNLSKRLSKIVSMVPKGSRIADVGCDHGFVTIELLENGIAASACALDVNRDPLEKARENARAHGLEDRIEFYLSNGLEKLPADKADTVIIAGMGGILITDILEGTPSYVKKDIKRYILAPQSEYSRFRHYLHDNGYCIIDEKMVMEDGKYYPIVVAEVSQNIQKYEKEIEYRYGKILIDEKDECLIECMRHDARIIKDLLKNDSLPESRRSELESELAQMEGLV